MNELRLNGKIVYINEHINIFNFFRSMRGVFSYVKVLIFLVYEYCRHERLFFTNSEILGEVYSFEERMLRYDFIILEKMNLVHRVWSKDGQRKGFKLNFVEIRKLLSLTKKDDDYLYSDERSHLRSIVNQSPISILKDFDRMLRLLDANSSKEANKTKIDEINRKKNEYNDYLKYQAKRFSKIESLEFKNSERQDALKMLDRYILLGGFEDPPNAFVTE